MNQQQQNPLDSVPLGRVIEEREIVTLPTSREVMFMRREGSVEDPPGVWRTQRETRVVPPLNCTCTPRDAHDIFECTSCLAVVCGRHSTDCQVCGLLVCTACMTQIQVEGQIIRLCRRCEAAAKTPTWLRLFKGLFKA